jgi:hypothetical protein
MNKLVNAASNNKLVNLSEWRLFSATGVTKMDNVLISGELAVDGGALQTSHIKWPKVPLKANESEGYVASASSSYNAGDYAAWHAFEDKGEYKNDISFPCWLSTTSPATFATGGGAQISRTTGDDTFEHEWLQIQLPQAIVLSYFYINESRYTTEAPKSGRMYGSNDGISFTKLATFSNKSGIVGRINVNATSAYKYYRLAITETQGSPDYVAINELQLFESTLGVGTSATTAKLTVDGGLGLAKGSQVFAGSDVITEFPKHDRPLTKYPEVAMTADSSGGYTATASTDAYANTGFYRWKAFNNTQGNEGWHAGEYNTSTNWYTTYAADAGGAVYDTANYSRSIAGIDGEWLKLEVPNPVRVDYIQMRARTGTATTQAPKDFKIIGSNDDVNWDIISTHTGVTASETGKKHIVGATKAYKYLAIVVTRVQAISASSHVVISELEYWGYEEGDESVDVVHRSIPNTPGQQQLAVYYEARDPNSYSFADSTKVYDLSGNGQTGTITGNNGFDAEYNAWVFDGSGDYIQKTNINSKAGNWIHSMTTWIYFNEFVVDKVFSVNPPSYLYGGHNETSAFYVRSTGFIWDFGMQNNNTTTLTPQKNKWYHIALVHDGTGYKKMYIDNVLQTSFSYSNNTNIVMQTGATLTIGEGNLNGKISNFRLFDKALNADQVRELYEYDAERFGHRQNVVALHKGNLGVGVPNPTSRFEVAGADGLQEYPPKAMTGYETYMEGHGVFRVTYSPWLGTGVYQNVNPGWQAFDNSGNYHNDVWHSEQNDAVIDGYYTGTDGAYTGTNSLGGILGDYVILESPYKTNITKINLNGRHQGTNTLAGGQTVKSFYFMASNDNATWDILTQKDNLTGWTVQGYTFDIPNTKYYRYYAVVPTKGNSAYVTLSELRYFGTPAPSSLEDGHLTLGKALTLPRVSGHPAGAETPRAESLVVHYDTTVDSVVLGSTVVDISGTGNNGTLNGDAAYSSTDRAFTFDGVDDYVSGTLNNPAGAWAHTVSMWLKYDGTTVDNIVFMAGSRETNKSFGLQFYTTGTKRIRYLFYSNDVDYNFTVD